MKEGCLGHEHFTFRKPDSILTPDVTEPLIDIRQRRSSLSEPAIKPMGESLRIPKQEQQLTPVEHIIFEAPGSME
jgi:hypothetical protein